MGSLEISYRTTMTMNTPEQVGMWLKSCRLERGMTQAELAKKAGVTQRLISDFERNKAVHGDPMVNLGVSYRFGAPYTNDAMTTGELQQKVVALNNQNLALEAQLESARSREDNMVKRVEKSKQELEALRAEIEQMKELLGLKAKMMKTSAKH